MALKKPDASYSDLVPAKPQALPGASSVNLIIVTSNSGSRHDHDDRRRQTRTDEERQRLPDRQPVGNAGGPGRTRTSNQTVMSESRFQETPVNSDETDDNR